MNPYDDENELTTYVWNHFRKYFSPIEAKAAWAVFADAKGKSSPGFAKMIWEKHKLAEDPDVTKTLADGIETFRRRAAKRVLQDHGSEVFVNRCPKCNRVVRTPKAQQCLWCGHDWHLRDSMHE